MKITGTIRHVYDSFKQGAYLPSRAERLPDGKVTLELNNFPTLDAIVRSPKTPADLVTIFPLSTSRFVIAQWRFVGQELKYSYFSLNLNSDEIDNLMSEWIDQSDESIFKRITEAKRLVPSKAR